MYDDKLGLSEKGVPQVTYHAGLCSCGVRVIRYASVVLEMPSALCHGTEKGLVLHGNSIKHHRAVHVSQKIDLERLDWRIRQRRQPGMHFLAYGKKHLRNCSARSQFRKANSRWHKYELCELLRHVVSSRREATSLGLCSPEPQQSSRCPSRVAKHPG